VEEKVRPQVDAIQLRRGEYRRRDTKRGAISARVSLLCDGGNRRVGRRRRSMERWDVL
jgi:hypothetical protein